MLVADHLWSRLLEWNVRRIYGYPGDGINGLLGALDRLDGKIEFVQARHEELAAFMACAHAKFTGEVGVCLATSGPGAIHLLNGLYDAKLDHQPVVAIVGQQARSALGGQYQQEVDLESLFKDVAHEFVQTIMVPTQVRHVVDRAVRIAQGTRAVTCVIVPNDVQLLDAVEEPPREHGTVHSSAAYATPRIVPRVEDLEDAAELLNAGKKVAILAGAGALHATDEVIAVAEALQAGVAKALLGKASLPDDLPYVTGSIGLLGTVPSWKLMDECDTLLIVGSSFPYSEFLPEEGQARAVQIDIDPRMIGLRYPTELNLVGDSADTLAALLPLLHRKQDGEWVDGIRRGVADWWQTLEKRAHVAANGINPQRLFWELSPRLPERCVVTCDSGSAANWYARDLKLRRGMLASLSGGLATMGPAVPYAIAAKLTHPGRPVVALVGDGAMQMNGLNGLITISQRWRDWKDPRLVILVLNNRDLNQVTWEQRVLSGDPKFPASQDLPEFDYARYAELIGLEGIAIGADDEVGEAWDRAFAAQRPVVIDARTDPDVPPLPPHINAEQAVSFIKSMAKGDPERMGTLRATMRQLFGLSRH
jgi:pyruvate dehydrogenase (quinone)